MGGMELGVLYIADGKMGLLADGQARELESGRLAQYLKTMRGLREQYTWKTGGSGARFMQQTNPLEGFDEEAARARSRVSGIAQAGGRLLYTIEIEGTSGMYGRAFDEDPAQDGVLFCDQRYRPGEIAVWGTRVAASISLGNEKHIGLLSLEKAGCALVTEGDTMEESPCWSPDGALIYFSTAGFGRDEQGRICAVGPRGIASYCVQTHALNELVAREGFNFVRPKAGPDGALYCIRYPYDSGARGGGNLVADLLLAPVRVAKAVGGWLNFFTQRYAGESLRSGGAKAKRKSEKELFIEGNLINVERAQKESRERGDPVPGLAPSDWALVRVAPDGSQEELKKGVLAFELLPGGGFVYSNGAAIARVAPDGRQELLGKVRLATRLALYDPSLPER